MRTFIFIGGIVIFLFVAAFISGFYPVALVDSVPVWERALKKTENAGQRFANVELQRTGRKPIDFSLPENAELLRAGRRDTLTLLIEDKILAEEGAKLSNDFETLVEGQINKALASGQDLEKAAELLYGLKFRDFRALVLLPQARSEVVDGLLKRNGQDFTRWLEEVKKRKRVLVIFLPFRWDGERIQ